MINLLKIELLKLKNSPVLKMELLMILISVITSLQVVLNMDSEIGSEELLNISMNMFGLFYYPIFITLFVAMIMREDNINNTWKVLLASGINKSKVYLAKYIFILIMVSTGVFLYILSVVGISIIKFNFTELFLIGIKRGIYIILSSLGIMAIEFIISLIFKSFLVPITVGTMGIFITLITSMSGEYIILNPFGYATNIAMGGMPKEYFLLSIVISIMIAIIIILYTQKIISKKDLK